MGRSEHIADDRAIMQGPRRPTPTRSLMICAMLAVMTFAVYSSVWRFEFLTHDDDEYVTQNPHVSAGISLRNIAWAFTTGHAANYHPLTWVSLQLDAKAFGLRPGWFHAENVLMHAACAILLFNFFKSATGDFWAPAFVAAVFVVHPTHVESVAWISERKDVLSTLFLLMAMLSYLRYCRGAHRDYGWMLLYFALSLLAKQMGVTLPVILLLLDYWPLGRLGTGIKKLMLEKLPLVVLTFAASAATFLAQRSGGAVVAAHALSAWVRLQGALIGYARYLFVMVWPVDLCVFYPYQRDWPLGEVLGSAVLLLLITCICLLTRRRQPWMIVGWSWFIVMLLPVIGIVQIGSASIADRYMYVPSVGLTIMLAWSVQKRLAARPTRESLLLMKTGALTVIALLGFTAYRQTQYWQHTRLLFRHATRVNNNEFDGHIQLAKMDQDEKDFSGAMEEYELAAKLSPTEFQPEYDMGNLLTKLDQPQLAFPHYLRASHLAPGNPLVQNNLAVACIRLSRPDLAVPAFHAAIAADPAYVDPHLNLGNLLESAGDFDSAIAEYNAALRIEPQNAQAIAGVQRI